MKLILTMLTLAFATQTSARYNGAMKGSSDTGDSPKGQPSAEPAYRQKTGADETFTIMQ